MTDATPGIPEVTDRDVFITRAFAAPREVVWKFFTEPELLAQWFGPDTVHVDPASVVIELREGGRWDLDMVDNATGEHYPLRSVIRVVRPPEYLEGSLEGGGSTVALRLWFHDHGDITRLTLHQGPFAAEQFRSDTHDGWELSFQKIDAILEATHR